MLIANYTSSYLGDNFAKCPANLFIIHKHKCAPSIRMFMINTYDFIYRIKNADAGSNKGVHL